MSHQASKRERTRRKVDSIRHTIHGESGTRLDSQVWFYRPVVESSAEDLSRVAMFLEGQNIAPKVGAYTLTLVHPADVNMGIRRSALRGFADAKRIHERLQENMPPTHDEEIEVELLGLRNFGSKTPWIALQATSPEIRAEGSYMMRDISSHLGIRATQSFKPHISIAKGSIHDITNMEEISALLPKQVTLGPMDYRASDPRAY